nr:TIGR03435 family protein [Granulicella aggregans]
MLATPTAPLAFEVASIHPHQGPLHVMMGFSSSGSRLTLEGYNSTQLILEAFNLKSYQVSWSSEAKRKDDIYYDIAAKAEGDAAPTKREFRQMLQTLLAQRFNLKFHPENKEMPVYLLVVGRNGQKIKSSAPDASEGGLFGVHGRNQTIAMPRESMVSLADDIRNTFMVDRPIVDRTGLTGAYDIKLEATPEFRIEHNPQPEDISVFTAVQEQLGLKLEPAKADVQVLMVDRIENPSDN